MNSVFHLDLLLILLMITVTVSITVKWIKVPYAIALVVVGLFIGLFNLLPMIEMTPDLILLVCLPALLFEASWNVHLEELKRNFTPIIIFATVGAIISMLLVGVLMHSLSGLSLGAALLFGAMISTTDPISILVLFRKIGIHQRLRTILEGESLFNDGSAVVLFKFMLVALMTGSRFSLPASIFNFIFVIVGGVVVGVALGFVASRLTKFFDDHLLEITLTTIVAYGSYLVAEQLQVSAVIAVFTAGIVLGNYGSRTTMTLTTRLAVDSFWEYAAFIVNSLIFLLIGLQIKFALLVKYALPILLAIVSVFIARAIAIYGLSFFFRSKQSFIPWHWRHILVWGGLRGALCMALALSLPHNFPEREILILLTFGVVLFTLLVPGLTVEPLARFLKITSTDKNTTDHQRLKCQLIINTRTIDVLKKFQRDRTISDMTYHQLHNQLALKQKLLEKEIEQIHIADKFGNKIEQIATKRQLLELQKDILADLLRTGALTDEAAQPIRLELDQELQETV